MLRKIWKPLGPMIVMILLVLLPVNLLAAPVGKISKLACGHMYTNISDSAVDIAYLVETAAGVGLAQVFTAWAPPRKSQSNLSSLCSGIVASFHLGLMPFCFCARSLACCHQAVEAGVRVRHPGAATPNSRLLSAGPSRSYCG